MKLWKNWSFEGEVQSIKNVKKVVSTINRISLLSRFAVAFYAFSLDEISWVSVDSGTKNSLKKYNSCLNSSFNFSDILAS